MTETDHNGYPLGETDWTAAPGEILLELLEERGLTQRDLVRRSGLSPQHANMLLQGVVPITAQMAERLEHVTGTPARLWSQLEASYRSDLERLRKRRSLADTAAWLDDMPVSALVGRGALPEEPRDTQSHAEQMLAFFGVASADDWDDVYGPMAGGFWPPQGDPVQRGAVAAWLRLGEVASWELRCADFDRGGLLAALPGLRELTVEPPDMVRRRLPEICAARGVAVVFVEEITGAPCSAATRWLTPGKVLIQLSDRNRTDDDLWFAFFHALGHVLWHGTTEVWIEGSETAADDPREESADRFARELLIPDPEAAELSQLRCDASVREFASWLGIAPGIVVGRLQHDGYWAASRGNHLKKRLVLTAADGGPD